MSILSAKGLSKSYSGINVLKNVHLQLEESKIVAIVGASGAGKTTLLHILGTLEQPDQGSITIKGKCVDKLSPSKIALFRNQNIGFVFQFHHLLPEFSALENVMIPGWIAGKTTKEAKQQAMTLMERLGMGARLHHKPSQLSGGECQRTAVARSLINNPAIVFADEPSGNLDSVNANELHHLFFELHEERKQTFIIVTHNEKFAQMAHHRWVMKDGQLKV